MSAGLARGSAAVFLLVAAVCLPGRGATAQTGAAPAPEAESTPDVTLDLRHCLDLALDGNPDIRTAWQDWLRVGGPEADGGEVDLERSRFRPRVNADMGWNRELLRSTAGFQADRNIGLSLEQRLFELGKAPSSLVALRESRREAWAAYEDQVAGVLASVRESFYLIVNRRTQVQERRRNLDEHRANLERVRARFEVGQVIKADVLTAELSVREEELRINSLERQVFRQTMELLDLLGEPLGVRVAVDGELPEFRFSEAEVVEAAVSSSTRLAVLEEEIKERRRDLAETRTLYWPDFAITAGVENKANALELTLDDAGSQTWGVDMSVTRHLVRSDDRFTRFVNAEDGRPDYFFAVSVDLPIFDGWRRRGQRRIEETRVARAEAVLDRERSSVELEARKAYQDYLEAVEELRIQTQTVAIAEERLKIQLELREYPQAGVTEDAVENFRSRYFQEQDAYFGQQDRVIRAQENLRRIMRVFVD